MDANSPASSPNGHPAEAAPNGAAHPSPREPLDGSLRLGTRAISNVAGDAGQSRELGRHPVTTYASVPEAERYRRIMRVFFLNKTRDLDWRLTPEQVAAKLRDTFGLVLGSPTL